MSDYKDVLNRILKFLNECEAERKFLNGDDELTVMMAYKSIAMDLTQIGESVNYLRKKYPEKLAMVKIVPWDDVVGLRNVIVHDYDGIIREEVEESLQLNLEDLKRAINYLIRNIGG
jgi:uncharacterized protein with HEPN domain